MKVRKMSMLLLLTGLFLTGCGQKQKAAEPLEMQFLKVGKADAILLFTEEKTMVIDAGEEDDGEKVLEALKEQGIEKIDYLIITHFDKDHVGGADVILKEIPAETVVQPDYQSDSKEYEQYAEALQERGIEPVRLRGEPMSFFLGDAEVMIFPPSDTLYAQAEESRNADPEVEIDNNLSLAIQVLHGGNSLLFTGDAEEARILELLQEPQILKKQTLLKVPHHGRDVAGMEELLTGTSPSYAIICCSKKNPADREVLKLLGKHGAETLLTANGDIQVLSDGRRLQIEQ